MRKALAGVSIGLAAVLVVLALGATGVLDRPELWAYDWRMRWTARPETVSKDIALVEINETSLLAGVLGQNDQNERC